jgi:hypothetical protein
MTTLRTIVCMTAIVACVGASRDRWSGEAKNDSSQLTDAQRSVFSAKLARLGEGHLDSILTAARPLSVSLDGATAVDQRSVERAVRQLSSALEKLLRADKQMRKLTFMTGEYLHPVSVHRTRRGYAAITDLTARVEGLRDQIGFFPEGPRTLIDDLEGYPRHQFAVATRGKSELLIRVPLVSDGYYLGDLTAEYALER